MSKWGSAADIQARLDQATAWHREDTAKAEAETRITEEIADLEHLLRVLAEDRAALVQHGSNDTQGDLANIDQDMALVRGDLERLIAR